MSQPARIAFRGHAQVRASDPSAIEIVAGEAFADRSRALGYAPEFEPAALQALRGRVRVAVEVDGLADAFEATISPGFARGAPLLFRREPASARALAVAASKGAADLDPDLRRRLAEPGAEGTLTLTPIAGDTPPPGLFALVGMPIGHQGDLSPRALDLLMSVDLIWAEDTRIAREALAWRGVKTPLASCYAQKEHLRAEELAGRLAAGERVAFVSDAGMPAVSDPGAELVRAAVEAGAQVTVLPGPSAPTAAVALSGFGGGGGFAFLGFPPRKGAERDRFLARVLNSPEPVALFEAPPRMLDLLADLAAAAPERALAACRDLTKQTEQVFRGTAAEIAQALAADQPVRGEFALVIDAAPSPSDPAQPAGPAFDLEAFVARLLAEGSPTQPVVSALRAFGLDRRTAYDLVQRLKP